MGVSQDSPVGVHCKFWAGQVYPWVVHRIPERSGLEGTLKPTQSHPPALGRNISHWPSCSSVATSTSRDVTLAQPAACARSRPGATGSGAVASREPGGCGCEELESCSQQGPPAGSRLPLEQPFPKSLLPGSVAVEPEPRGPAAEQGWHLSRGKWEEGCRALFLWPPSSRTR